MTGRKITTIPATRRLHTGTPITATKARRVAGYARVSTDHDDQISSYHAQVDYYTHYITTHTGWELAGIYTDEGITGTSTAKRQGFQSMVADALDGKIDLIITKSVSRFARNTVDSLTTVRALKDKGVEVYFEKENIWTFDAKGELLITIMSSLAQEEARSISENVTWGHRKRFADGKVSVPYSRFLGYDKGENGGLVINPEQAKLVRRIYSMFLDGMGTTAIARTLTNEPDTRTASGNERWSPNLIRSILSNEKYRGDALLQKSYTPDFLHRRQVPNMGEVPQYYVTGAHEAIISPAVWDFVQAELARTKSGRGTQHRTRPFSGKIVCGDCGGYYGSKTWHAGTKYEKTIWRCNHKYDSDKRCRTPHIDNTCLEELFLQAVKDHLNAPEDPAVEAAILRALDTRELEIQAEGLAAQIDAAAKHMDNLIACNSRTVQDQDQYERDFNQAHQRHQELLTQHSELLAQIQSKNDRQAAYHYYKQEIGQLDTDNLEFSPYLCITLLNSIEASVEQAPQFKFHKS